MEYTNARESTIERIVQHVQSGRHICLSCPAFACVGKRCHVDELIKEIRRRAAPPGSDAIVQVTIAQRQLAHNCQLCWRVEREGLDLAISNAEDCQVELAESAVCGYWEQLLAQASARGVHALEAMAYAIAAFANNAAVGKKGAANQQAPTSMP